MTRLRLAVFTGVSLALIGGTPSSSFAQCEIGSPGAQCDQQATVAMTIGRVIQLQMAPTSTALTEPTPAHFDAGFNSTTGPVLTVSANSAWTLRMQAATAVWGATNTSPGEPARTDKPAANLRWSRVAAGPFVAMRTNNVTLTNAAATASNVTTLFYRTNYSWLLDTPGIYTLGIVLTLTSP
jgi:hypothetical protein